MNILKVINIFIFGEAAKGEPIISKQPTFKTYYPVVKTKYNEWANTLQISSGYIKYK